MNRRGLSIKSDIDEMLALHTTDAQRVEYREALNTLKRPLTRLERLCMGHTIEAPARGRQFSRSEMRIWEVNRLISYRHGMIVPENDDPHDGYAFVIACTMFASISEATEQEQRLALWMSTFLPWVNDVSASAASLLRKMEPRRKHLTDRGAGACVRLTINEREVLRIKTLSPSDMKPLQFSRWRKEKKRQADRERDEAKRRARGAKPQDQSKSQVKPWVAEGCSKATWYRRQAKNETISSHAYSEANSAGETTSSPLIDSRIGREESVSTVAGVPSLAPDLHDLSLPAGGGSHPADQPDRLEPVPSLPVRIGETATAATRRASRRANTRSVK